VVLLVVRGAFVTCWLVEDGVAQIYRGLRLRIEVQRFLLNGRLCRKS